MNSVIKYPSIVLSVKLLDEISQCSYEMYIVGFYIGSEQFEILMLNLIDYLRLCEKLGPTTSIKVLTIIDYLLKYGSSGCIDEFK